jgi:hypothetical protein
VECRLESSRTSAIRQSTRTTLPSRVPHGSAPHCYTFRMFTPSIAGFSGRLLGDETWQIAYHELCSHAAPSPVYALPSPLTQFVTHAFASQTKQPSQHLAWPLMRVWKRLAFVLENALYTSKQPHPICAGPHLRWPDACPQEDHRTLHRYGVLRIVPLRRLSALCRLRDGRCAGSPGTLHFLLCCTLRHDVA